MKIRLLAIAYVVFNQIRYRLRVAFLNFLILNQYIIYKSNRGLFLFKVYNYTIDFIFIQSIIKYN